MDFSRLSNSRKISSAAECNCSSLTGSATPTLALCKASHVIGTANAKTRPIGSKSLTIRGLAKSASTRPGRERAIAIEIRLNIYATRIVKKNFRCRSIYQLDTSSANSAPLREISPATDVTGSPYCTTVLLIRSAMRASAWLQSLGSRCTCRMLGPAVSCQAALSAASKSPSVRIS